MLTDHVSEWAKPYGMPVRTVDGNDVEQVLEAAKLAVDYVRTQRKPYFLETYTYRTRGHMEPDDQSYVDKNELAARSGARGNKKERRVHSPDCFFRRPSPRLRGEGGAQRRGRGVYNARMRIIVAALTGAVIVFVVSALTHMATPLGTTGISTLPDETIVRSALRNSGARSGLYLAPFGFLVYTADGGVEMSPRELALEFASVFLAALIAAWLLARMTGTYLLRASAVGMLAVFAFLSVTASHWIWYRFPTEFVLAALLVELIAWLCAGLVMAKIVRAPVRLA